MTTASIPELRKAHTRTRAQLARAAFRLDTAKAAGDQAAAIEAGKALQEAAIVVCERGPHRLRPGRQGD